MTDAIKSITAGCHGLCVTHQVMCHRQVAEQLRKPADITFCHVTPPAAESASTGDSCEEQTVHLNPEPISIHPVQYAVLDRCALAIFLQAQLNDLSGQVGRG